MAVDSTGTALLRPNNYFRNSQVICTTTFTIVDENKNSLTDAIVDNLFTYKSLAFITYNQASTVAATYYLKAVTASNIPLYKKLVINDVTPKCRMAVPTLTEAQIEGKTPEITFTANQLKLDTISTTLKASNYITNSNSDCIVKYSIVDSNKLDMKSEDNHYGFITVEKDGEKDGGVL